MGQWLERLRTVKGKAWLEDDPERKPPLELAANWETEWGALAKVTPGITISDSRFQPLCEAIEKCDRALEQGNFVAFKKAAAHAKDIIKNQL